MIGFLKELDVLPKHPTWRAATHVVEPREPPQAYSSLVLLGFNEEEMLEEEADEILDKNPEVVSELGQEAAEDGIKTTEDGAAAAKGGLDVKEANLSYDL